MGKKSQTPKDTERDRALAHSAATRFNIYQRLFVPMENKLMEQVAKQQSEAAYATAGAVAQAEAAPQVAAAVQQQKQQAMARGANPASGAFNSPALEKAAAKGMGLGTVAAQNANTDRYYQGTMGLLMAGEGQASEGMAGLGASARRATNTEIGRAEAAHNASASTQRLIGVAGGIGAGVYAHGKGEDLFGGDG